MGGNAVDDYLVFPSSTSEVTTQTVVLVGKTGNGKSATGNSILGRNAFTSKTSFGSVTSTCELQETVLEDGQFLNVIDTPGLLDSEVEPVFILNEIMNCVNMAKDGIHAVIVVLSVSRFSREEVEVILTLQNLFGSKISDYMIVVFTGGDALEKMTLDDLLGRDCPETLKEILKMCGNRCVLFDNKTNDEEKKSKQLKQLLSLVNTVMDNKGGKPYTDERFIELKEGAIKLRDNSLERYSKQEVSELRELFKRLYDEQLKRIIEMLKETTNRLEQQLAEEKSRRLKAEEMAQEAHMKSDEEIRKLTERVERAERETKDLRNQAQSGKCAIL